MAPETKDLSWPFSTDGDGYLVFAPRGLYGATYFVPDSKTYYRIQHKCSVINVAPTLLGIVFSLIDSLCERQPWAWKLDIVMFVTLLGSIIWIGRTVKLQASGLVMVSARPSLRRKFVIGAQNVPSTRLWCCQMIAILISVLLLSVAQHPYKQPELIGYVALTTFILPSVGIACICSYLLNLKQRIQRTAKASV